MKKKIIFVTEALWIGGLEVSLLNMLERLDYDLYEVTVLALRDYQELASRVPKQCKLLIADRYNQVSFSNPYKHRWLFGLMEEPQNATKFRRIVWRLLCFFLKSPEAIMWSHYIKDRLKGEKYDVAVIYDNRTAETAVRAIAASKFLMFYHQGVMSHAYHDIHGWKKASRIIAVSDPIAMRLRTFMPKYADKVISINNIVDVNTVLKKSKEEVDLQFDCTKINIVSCGRLSREKGMHIAVDVCAELRARGLTNFLWYFIGDGREMSALSTRVEELQIADCVVFLGQKDNPFPYLKQADLFVQTSLFESFGLSMAEAMILGLPIVSTKTDGAVALTNNGQYGLLCGFEPKELADAIEPLLLSREKLQHLKNAAMKVDVEKQNREAMCRLNSLLRN